MMLAPRRILFHLLTWGGNRGSIYSPVNHVGTWSTLASAFNTKPSRKLNFSLTKNNGGLFGIPELTDYTKFYLLDQNVQEQVEHLVEEAMSSTRQRKMVEVFDELSDTLCRIADMSDFVRVAHPDKDFSQAANEVCINLSALVERLNTNVPLYESLRSVIENDDCVATDDVDKHVAKLFLFDFEQSGIHLEEKKRQRFVELNESILMVGGFFAQASHKPKAIPKSKLPANIRQCFTIDGDNAVVTGLHTDHIADLVREAAYRIFLYPDSHQEELLHMLLSSRNELAQLVGFPTYGHRALRGTLVQTPENAMDFLQMLADRLRPHSDVDYDLIRNAKSQAGSSDPVQPWDPGFYSALIRQNKYQLDPADITPYFSLGCCVEGVNTVLRCLFNVTLQRVEPELGELWHYDVHKVAVVQADEGLLGYIYCDFFERADKPNQDCHFTIRGGRLKSDGSYQLPMVVLSLNFPLPPNSTTPSLLSLGMMENLFHEFGHAMHSMLGRTKYQHVTGTRCPTDFAEVPSVLMEYFATDERVLSSFARHYKTGVPMPRDMVEKLCSSRRMFAASEMQLQVFYSIVDQVYHGKYPCGKSTTEILADIQNSHYGIPHIEGTAWQLRFSHLVGYGAKYYAYLMSRAVASRIWHTCFQDDPFNRTMGEKYRRKVLAHGGGKHPQELVQDMLGETMTVERLVDSLVEDIQR